jgi:probable rRNA maturation factor
MTVLSHQRFDDSTISRFNITIANRQRTCPVDLRLLRRIAKTLVTEFVPTANCDLGVYLVGVSEMTRLNETFLRHAGPTDVIAFDYSSHASRLAPCPFHLCAEIFICVDEAVAQACGFRTSWQAEVVRYLIHGLLHLRGYGDATPGRRLKMKCEENRLLREVASLFPLRKLGIETKLRA